VLAVENIRTSLACWIYGVHRDKMPLKGWWLKALVTWNIFMQASSSMLM